MKRLIPGRKVTASALLPSMVAVFVGAAISIPSATASPGCSGDRSTPDEFLGCWGGGPWQEQDGSSPDTYGPTGERGFLAENRTMLIFPELSDATLLKLGYAACSDRSRGVSDDAMQQALINVGADEVSAGAFVTNTWFLCSG